MLYAVAFCSHGIELAEKLLDFSLAVSGSGKQTSQKTITGDGSGSFVYW